MAPEQLDARPVTPQSDLFSLGVTLFQLLTGMLPFRSDSIPGLMQKISAEPHPPLRVVRPDLPRGAGGDHRPRAREGPGGPLPERRRDGAGAARLRARHRPGAALMGRYVSLRNRVQAVGLTDTGKVREHNEDSICARRRHRPVRARRRHGRLQRRRGRERHRGQDDHEPGARGFRRAGARRQRQDDRPAPAEHHPARRHRPRQQDHPPDFEDPDPVRRHGHDGRRRAPARQPHHDRPRRRLAACTACARTLSSS